VSMQAGVDWPKLQCLYVIFKHHSYITQDRCKLTVCFVDGDN